MPNASEARPGRLVGFQDPENAILISDHEPNMNAYAAMPSGGHMARLWPLCWHQRMGLRHSCDLSRDNRNQAGLGVGAVW